MDLGSLNEKDIDNQPIEFNTRHHQNQKEGDARLLKLKHVTARGR
jgi:hypothetical protein